MTNYSNPVEFTNEFREEAAKLMDAYYTLSKLLEVAEDFGYTMSGSIGPRPFTDTDFVNTQAINDITAVAFYHGMETLSILGDAITPEVRRALNAMRR